MHQKIDSVRPTNSAVHEHQLPAIQAELDKQRRCRIDQLDELAVDAAEVAATGDECSLQVTRDLQVAAESAMGEIEAALERLENGSYGICERCTEPIPFERLEILPMTRLCTPCQYLAESGRSRTRRPNKTPCPSAGSGDRGHDHDCGENRGRARRLGSLTRCSPLGGGVRAGHGDGPVRNPCP